MAYMLERFADVVLPVGNPQTDISPVRSRVASVETMAGAFDLDGDSDAKDLFPHPISYAALTIGDTYAEWRAIEDALRVLVGKRGRLYRRAEDDDSVQWALCRLVALPGPRATRDKKWKASTFDFLQLSHWRGVDHREWELDDGEILDDGLYLDEDVTTTYTHPLTLTLTNGGNARVDDAVITITAGGVAITNTYIRKTGETELHYAGIVAAGDSLVIDTGAYSVLNDGTDDYISFELDDDHVINEWLRLDSGANSVTITLTTANLIVPPTVKVEFMDAWK